MNCDPTTLAEAAKCLVCLSEKQLMAINAYLLCQITNNGSGADNNNVVYVADPNSEALVPPDQSAAAFAYSNNSALPTFYWNTTTHVWQ